MHLPQSVRRHPVLFALLTCCVSTLLAYHSRLDAFFFQDDLAMVAHGVDCWRTGDIHRLFSTDQYDIPAYNRLRPVVLSMFTLLYHAFGLQPFWFRLVNVLTHTASGGLVMWLARRQAPRTTAVLAGALFLTWPALTNAVFPICTMTDCFAGFFSLAAVCVFVHLQSSGTRRAYLRAMPIVCLFYLLGQFSKETAICTPPLLVVASRFGARRSWRDSVVATTPVVLLTAAYLLWRRLSFGVFLTGFKTSFFAGDLRTWGLRYVEFWFDLLTHLNYELSKVAVTYRYVPVMVGATVVVSLICLGAVALIWRRTGVSPATRLGLAILAVAIVPVSYYPLDRNFYIPAMGLSIALASGCTWAYGCVREHPLARRSILVGFALLALARIAIADAHCRNNGKAGDLFASLVHELDAISQRLPAGDADIYLLATPSKILTPVWTDTPWIICGGEAGAFQQLQYGAQRSRFHYGLEVDLHKYPTPEPAITFKRLNAHELEIALSPSVDFDQAPTIDQPSAFGRVAVLERRTYYHFDFASRIRLTLDDALIAPHAHVFGFDGAHVVALAAP